MADNHLLKSSGLFLFRHVSLLQGCYYLINGIWPLLSSSSFQAVTGPKTDLWLVKTVGLLLLVNGAILILAAYRRQIDLPVTALGIGTALAQIGVELAYVFSGVISVWNTCRFLKPGVCTGFRTMAPWGVGAWGKDQP